MLDRFAERAAPSRGLRGVPAAGVALVGSAAGRPIDEPIALARQVDRAGMRLPAVAANRICLDPGDPTDSVLVEAAVRVTPVRSGPGERRWVVRSGGTGGRPGGRA